MPHFGFHFSVLWFVCPRSSAFGVSRLACATKLTSQDEYSFGVQGCNPAGDSKGAGS